MRRSEISRLNTPAISLLLALTLLSGCGHKIGSNACPFVPDYTDEQKNEAAAHVEALPDGHPVQLMFADYGVMRADSRACAGD